MSEEPSRITVAPSLDIKSVVGPTLDSFAAQIAGALNDFKVLPAGVELKLTFLLKRTKDGKHITVHWTATPH